MQKKLERLLAQISSDDDDDDNKFVTPTNSKKGTKNKAPPPRSPSRSPSVAATLKGDEQPSESIDSTFHTRNSVADSSILGECT